MRECNAGVMRQRSESQRIWEEHGRLLRMLGPRKRCDFHECFSGSSSRSGAGSTAAFDLVHKQNDLLTSYCPSCHFRLTRELEKKFSDRHVVFVGQRRILGKPGRRSRVKQQRPRSRTLTAVHTAILEDLVFPTEITGKRTRVATDGNKLIKCFLDSKDATSLEYKLDSFASVYRKLTGKDVTFMFKVNMTLKLWTYSGFAPFEGNGRICILAWKRRAGRRGVG